MENIGIRDIVYKRNIPQKLFMVVDYTVFGNEVEYELMQVYPVMENSDFDFAYRNEIVVKCKDGTNESDILHKLIKAERTKKGYVGLPDFVKVAIDTTSALFNNDYVEYTRYKKIDECLDALNDLKMLHDEFGDKEYLDSMEIVKKRMREIQELELMRENG